ncbi:ATP-binding protein [Streptomyces stramineus]
MGNVVKHARATHVRVGLAVEGSGAGAETVLTVRDNGVGFDKRIVQRRLREGHIGLASHHVRVESAGGRLRVDSSGAGTAVEVRLPADARPAGPAPDAPVP